MKSIHPKSAILVFLALFSLSAWILWGQALEENPNPHENPFCTPRGGPNSVRCECLGMVAQIQRQMADRCWQAAGFPGPPPDLPGVEPPPPPPEVLACMGRGPDHCEIISNAFPWQRWRLPVPEWVKEREKKGLRWPNNSCSTRCRPEKCGCKDQACKSHQESDIY